MLPDLSVPPHWPEKIPASPCDTHQDAVRILHELRQMIVRYRRKHDRDWRVRHAQTEYIVNVVAGLIADARAIDRLHAATFHENLRLTEQVKKLKADVDEGRRPFTAQMEMQNRRITALNEQIQRMRLGLE